MRRIHVLLLAVIAGFTLAACGSASKEFVWQRVETTVATRADPDFGPLTLAIHESLQR